MTTTGCGLIEGIFELLHLVSGSSDSLNKTPEIHMVSSIVVMWRRINESTPETHFLYSVKINK